MTFSEAQRTYLLADSQLSIELGERIFPEKAKQDTPRPYVIYHIELREPEPTLDGPCRMLEAAIDYTIVADEYDDAFALAEMYRARLSYFRGPMSGFQIESFMLDEIIGGYTAEIDLFTANVRFTAQYPPQ